MLNSCKRLDLSLLNTSGARREARRQASKVFAKHTSKQQASKGSRASCRYSYDGREGGSQSGIQVPEVLLPHHVHYSTSSVDLRWIDVNGTSSCCQQQFPFVDLAASEKFWLIW